MPKPNSGTELADYFRSMDEKMFEAMLKDLEENGPQEAINDLKLAYNEFCAARDQVLREKGEEYSFLDVKAKIPNNLWVKLMEIAFS